MSCSLCPLHLPLGTARELRSALRTSSPLLTLNVGQTSFEPQACQALVAGLDGNRALKNLVLEWVKPELGETEVAALSAVLPRCCLTGLYLKGCIHHISRLSSALPKCSIQSLCLQHNHGRIGDREVKEAIAPTLSRNDTLETLDLRGNNISDEGATALHDTIRYANSSLSSLRLEHFPGAVPVPRRLPPRERWPRRPPPQSRAVAPLARAGRGQARLCLQVAGAGQRVDPPGAAQRSASAPRGGADRHGGVDCRRRKT